MDAAETALLASAAAYAGFQWTIRLVVYPQMRRVDPAGFAAYEAAHQRAVTRTVGPLFAAAGMSCLALLAVRPGPASLAACGLFAGILGLTWFGAVPQHRRLAAGFDVAAHRRLLTVDTGRLLLSLALVGLAVVLALT